ncbi:hypothetical protein [Fictibacillus barbaricus]|uniref:Uncharacterized protein n=1 Tax=Fictibacillus barbaricus TaxID=182136 RepID=A0ABU1U089_9BACL|nr:hypothetical protein [Fictibacillus barbaricus]MDR7072887.1 hypothetical protein [Fictibacillus barbaricus]
MKLTFEYTWPYERMMNDLYVSECPFCKASNVLTSFKEEQLALAKEGVKQRLIMPCCHGKMTILNADDDYFYTDEKLRARP